MVEASEGALMVDDSLWCWLHTVVLWICRFVRVSLSVYDIRIFGRTSEGPVAVEFFHLNHHNNVRLYLATHSVDERASLQHQAVFVSSCHVMRASLITCRSLLTTLPVTNFSSSV